MEETFEPQSLSSVSSISTDSLEIDFCSISIPLEVNNSDDSIMDFFFETEEQNSSSFITSLFDSSKDDSSSSKHTNNTTPIRSNIIHKPIPVRRNKGLYCRNSK